MRDSDRIPHFFNPL